MGDALLRRTRLGLLDARRLSEAASEGAELVAQAMGAELGWDDARRRAELERWQEGGALVREASCAPGLSRVREGGRA